jgi:protein-L-isoaspartate(D-aspartate) O-methyltransferase
VIGIEIDPALAKQATARLRRLGLRQASARLGDGRRGLPEEAPFDRIQVAAAGPKPSRELMEQLADGGRLVQPVGDWSQQMIIISRTGDDFRMKHYPGFQFVPLRSPDDRTS